MIPFALKDIKVERLFLALVFTFLLADTVPHPQLGESFTQLSWQKITHHSR